MEDKELFKKFLEEYFENIKEHLPQSYRARQLNAGGVAEMAVVKFECKFLEGPFMKALEEAKKNGRNNR